MLDLVYILATLALFALVALAAKGIDALDAPIRRDRARGEERA